MFALAVTDPRWYEFMLAEHQAEPLNFWTPTPWKPKIPEGSAFGFMVKAPYRKIGGYGCFRRYLELSIDDAWQRFRTANGVPNRETFRQRIIEFAKRRSSNFIEDKNTKIGCIILEDCVFLPHDQMVSPNEMGLSFPDQIVKWKGFDGNLRLPEWAGLMSNAEEFILVDPDELSWEVRKAKKRASQAVFRDRILAAYGGRCAISGETCSTVLEAAHIQPFYSTRSNHVQNGLCLRSDFHRLFDAGLIAINDDFDVLVSRWVESSSVQHWAGKPIHTPNDPSNQPSRAALDFHRRSTFRA